MKRRVARRVGTIVFFAALSFYSSALNAQEIMKVREEPTVDRMAVYMTSGALNSMNFKVDVSSSLGVSQLYVRGQDPEADFTHGPLDFSWNQSEQKTSNGTNYSSSSSFGSSTTRTFWAAPTYNEMRIKGSLVKYEGTDVADNLYDFSPFHQTRVGIQCGANWTGADDRNSIGAIISYGRGHMRGVTDIKNASDETTFKMIDACVNVSDMQFGGSWVHSMDCGAKLTTVVLGGFQDYGWRRSVIKGSNINSDSRYQYIGITSGNTLGVMVSLSKSFDCGYGWSWTPRADFESAHSWIYSSYESGQKINKGDAEWSYNMSGQKIIADRNTFRGGVTLTYADDNGDLSLTAMYGRQLEDGFGLEIGAGEDLKSIVKSHGYGQDSLLTGASVNRYLNAEKTMQIGGDYQLTLYKKATNQMISAVFATQF